MTVRPGFPESNQLIADLIDIKRRLTDLERAASLPFSSIGSGGITVKDSGQITFLGSNGQPLVTIDQDGAVIAGAPVTLDADGLRVGDDVVVDDTGLQVIGGYVTPIEAQRYADTAANVSLTTTQQDIITLNLTPPSWAQEMRCQLFLFGQMSAGGSTQNLITQFRVGTETAFAQMEITVPASGTNAGVNFSSIIHGSAGISLPSSFDVKARAAVNTGTNSSNQFRFSALIDFMRFN